MKKFIAFGMIVAAVVGIAAFPVFANQFVTGAMPLIAPGLTNEVTNLPPANYQLQVYPNTAAITITVPFSGGQSGTSNFIYALDYTTDGTNWTTAHPWGRTNALSGTNALVDIYQLTATQLLNVKAIAIDYYSVGQQSVVIGTPTYTVIQ